MSQVRVGEGHKEGLEEVFRRNRQWNLEERMWIIQMSNRQLLEWCKEEEIEEQWKR